MPNLQLETVGIGMAAKPVDSGLIVHVISVSIFFTIVSMIFINHFNYTTPQQTAMFFVGCGRSGFLCGSVYN